MDFIRSLTILDYGIIVILAVPSIIGLFKGFFTIVFRLLGIVFGFGLGIIFATALGDLLRSIFNSESVFISRLAAFILLFAGCWIIGILLGKIFKKFIKAIKMGWFDRVMGFMFGLTEGMCLVGAICIVMVLLPAYKSSLTKSRIALPLIQSSIILVDKLPDTWDDYLDPHRWIGHYREKVIEIYKSK